MSKIDHPDYYKAGGIEAIDVIEDWKLDFCLGNAIKYIARAGKKSDDVKTDLEKAAWYIKRHKRGIERGILKKIPPKPTTFLPANLNSAWDLGFPLWSVISRIYDAPRLDKRSGVTYLNSISRAIECLEVCIDCLPQETNVKRKEENKK
nr:MAG TPA: nucelotide kinase [Caudoviricetes sp.]